MTFKGRIEEKGECRFEIDPDYQSEGMKRRGVKMNVPGLVYTDRRMLDSIAHDDSLSQVVNVATLPGIVGYSFAMPDIHHGYGFPIGGVAAFDASSGVISPGGVGYDINCGVRLLRTDLRSDEIGPKVGDLLRAMFTAIPCGVGSEGRINLSPDQMDSVLRHGSRWAVNNGYGWDSDLEATEEMGAIDGADPSLTSVKARKRGTRQLGTLGAGNHFLEIQEVDEIFDSETASTFGITEVGQVTVMIHTGSRGLGHQVCTDYLEVMRRANRKYGIPLLDQELSCAPASSPEGQDYFAAMKCAANYAWANRQLIMHWVRQSFADVIGESAERLGMHLVYDIAHNMAKLEQHQYQSKSRLVVVHRKGATRAFGPGHSDVTEKYRAVGQPVLIPGDMGTASYLLVGTEQGMTETFGSSCHGAGRLMSRHAARRKLPVADVLQMLDDKGIHLQAKTRRLISEEAPGAYKDVEQVVEITHRAGLARKVARLRPLGVVKG